MRVLASGCLTAVLLASAGCKGADSTTPAPICSAPQGSSSSADALAAANLAFAVALYLPAASAAAQVNVVVSPFSIASTMMMVGAGASGDTATQIQSVLHLPAPAANEAPAYAALACDDETSGSSGGDALLIANSVWAQQGKAYLPTFLSVLQSGYQAPLQQVDFPGDPGGTASTINAWVSKQTQAKIPALLQPSDLSTTTVLVLANAVYFKGAWSTAFDPNRTTAQPFTLSDGTRVMVPTMSGSVDLGQGSLQGVFVYELGYKDGALAMDFLMPQSGPSLSSFEASLTPDLLASVLAGVGPRERIDEVTLPKFSFDTRLELAQVLAGMGMPDLFDPSKADLSGMDGQRDLFAGHVVHEALLAVDEQGTVAAAATAGGVQTSSASTAAIDRPFVFLIRNTKNGHILFMGRVLDPR